MISYNIHNHSTYATVSINNGGTQYFNTLRDAEIYVDKLLTDNNERDMLVPKHAFGLIEIAPEKCHDCQYYNKGPHIFPFGIIETDLCLYEDRFACKTISVRCGGPFPDRRPEPQCHTKPYNPDPGCHA